MAYLAKGKKQDLVNLANELNITVQVDFKIIDLKNAILKSVGYDEEFTKELLENFIAERKENEARLIQKENDDRAFELEKLKLQNSNSASETGTILTASDSDVTKFEIKGLIPQFDPKVDDVSTFLNLFERQLTFLKIPESKWVVYLIGLLPIEISKLIAIESDSQDNPQEYGEIKKILLRRFKMSAEKFRQSFIQHRKSPDSTWRDFFYDLRNFFEGWLNELNITTFDQLKDLIISDQIKRKCPPDYKDHFLEHWSELNDPVSLVDKLDSYEEIINLKGKNTNQEKHKKENFKYKSGNDFKNYKSSGNYKYSTSKTVSKINERPISCYGCGKPGFIKAKCPTCSPGVKVDSAQVSCLTFQTCTIQEPLAMLMKIKINGMLGLACADTGASHTVAGETLYNLLREQGVNFHKVNLNVTLADGMQKFSEVYNTKIDIELMGKRIPTTLFALPTAKDNRTLLGTDFLSKAGICLDTQNRKWYFNCNPRKRFNFEKDAFILASKPNKDTSDSPGNSQNDSTLSSDKIIESPKLNTCVLKETEGSHLSAEERLELGKLLEKFTDIFQLGEEPTDRVKHYIDTGDNLPVAMPPYRMSPLKKDILKKELEKLLANGTIEECESPYSAPVVLVPKPNGQVRLCVDYRKLNSITKTDKYPLPRMDDLLHEAKHTPYMSTIDLRSGYHQIEVNPSDRDKTAFVCPFGTFRYCRMPFGLKNAPATFQRLIDNFRNSLKDVLVLSYLDDIIILSETFEKHLDDLGNVLSKLREFKLHANREKCNFACNRVKYLGHYITHSGLEVDPDKVAAIQNLPPPRNLKQVQSFLQTCSWYRRFVPNFSDIARPLSNLTKKNVSWKWEEEEENAFKTLKCCLISPPVLRQNDQNKPYILRTDASSYALGAVLLQGEGAEEHPIEYASRLLNDAERNYTTTEREALAVVWALNKFRGYIEGQDITVASDHQPLRWLMSLKSPTGRLARWALQVQSFAPKMEYIPGKANVVADLLSRPFCQHAEEFCQFCKITIDMPTRNPREIREQQLKDEDLKKIIESFENPAKDENFTNWLNRGYLLNQGVLYRYSPEADTEEAQLVVPKHECERILKEYHDAPMAGHYGIEGTLSKIAKRYYWTGMRRFITEYIKNCEDCCRYKASNQKPSGLLQTPVYNQRFESISIDLFGPLPKSPDGKKWIFIVEDCATRWTELFALEHASARECAITLIEEVYLRYGFPRRLISDNGSQFVSSVMQQVCYLLDIDQVLTPVYHPRANPVERKNRDLKPRLAILVKGNHTIWSEKLPTIRFALNTARCDTTGETAAFLMFGRELRTTDDVTRDLRAIISNDNFVPEITPYLKRFTNYMKQLKSDIELKQDKNKFYADKRIRKSPQFKAGDQVWVNLHPKSQAKSAKTAKLMPRRDGPYVILKELSPTTYLIATQNNPFSPIGKYHSSCLQPFRGETRSTTPVLPLRLRGRPKKSDAEREPIRNSAPVRRSPRLQPAT
jgi:hypothetical protein